MDRDQTSQSKPGIDRSESSEHLDTNTPATKQTSFIREMIETALIAIIVFVLVHSLVLNFVVEGSSMQPTLSSGERILVNRNAYGEFDLGDLVDWIPGVPQQHWLTITDWGDPHRGDVVVLTPPKPGEQKPHIKRIIGLPGDHVQIAHGKVFVNGVALEEEYTGGYQSPCAGSGSYAVCDVTVPTGHVFVMGDHRNNSADSRYFDTVPIERIIGRAWLIYWPANVFGPITSPDFPELSQ